MNKNILDIALLKYDNIITKKLTKKYTNIFENIKNYNTIGFFNIDNNEWSWSYNYFKSKINLILDFINNNDISSIIKYTFNTHKFTLTDNIQLDIILALSLYYLKSNKLYYVIKKNYIQFIIK